VELLVAISVLTLMMSLAARIFFDAQEGVKRGVQVSQIIAESRSVSQPLAEDMRQMYVFESKYGANTPGLLIIAQQSFGNVRYPIPDEPDVGPGPNGNDWLAGVMRSDQVAFFRDASDLESLTPGTDFRFDSEASARHARIWYGHVSPVTGGASLDPGDVDYRLATQMVLGRQALLLVEESAATTHPDGTPGNAAPSVDNRIAATGGGVPANTFEGASDVLNLNGFTRNSNTYGVYDDGGIDPVASPRALFRTPTYSVASPTRDSHFGNLAAADGLPTLNYANAAAEWLYLLPGQRLQAETALNNDFSAGIFTADNIARLHAAFAPHVADFAVEFAADWEDEEGDGQPDFTPDRDTVGNIIWYTLINPNPDLVAPFGVGDNDARAPITYDANLVPLADFDGTTGTTPAGSNPLIYGNIVVWSHTGDDIATEDDPTTPLINENVVEGAGKYWPYLIRYRFRLMDGKGEYRTIATDPTTDDDYAVVGRWFEQIVSVPRPRGLY
jgi:hypothetical protein